MRTEDTGLWRRLTCNSWAVGSSRVRLGDTDLWGSLTRNSSQDDATVKCWGYNSLGQLGQGDTSARGDDINGGSPARPTRGCAGREEGWGLVADHAALAQRWGRTFLRSIWGLGGRLSRSPLGTISRARCW